MIGNWNNLYGVQFFPRYKFVTSNDKMNYSMEKQSMSQIILNGINCNGSREQVVWNELKTNVCQILKICQSNTTAALETGFKGKFFLHLLYIR